MKLAIGIGAAGLGLVLVVAALPRRGQPAMPPPRRPAPTAALPAAPAPIGGPVESPVPAARRMAALLVGHSADAVALETSRQQTVAALARDPAQWTPVLEVFSPLSEIPRARVAALLTPAVSESSLGPLREILATAARSETREMAIALLGADPSRRGVDALRIAAGEDPDPKIRSLARSALGEVPEAAPAPVSADTSSDPSRAEQNPPLPSRRGLLRRGR